MLANVENAPIAPRLKALLAIADKAHRDGRLVEAGDVERERAEGADDRAIHDTVLIAAAFCMYNRYEVGLGTWASRDPADYVEGGKRLAEAGYIAFDYGKLRGAWKRPEQR
ncbi:hypothetical protein [Paludisphaera mucosa]|uniref:Uncharacterized protein n=1 Tax=Paludisphaera mucosa TaxID=3030827 RepID=A0ABT6FF31_9BACT|nr:hypothetical protein [Paludisphaera mucosa]MDG3006174.1 hypothetical protein [Paludisphaera mucosa]